MDEFPTEKMNRSSGELVTLFYSTVSCLHVCVSTEGTHFGYLLFLLMTCQIPKLLTLQPAEARVPYTEIPALGIFCEEIPTK